MAYKHIIFDCDGVLIDSEPLSMRIDVELMREHGITITEAEAHHRFVGTTFEAMLVNMSQENGVTFREGLSEEKDRRLEELYRRELKAVPQLHEVLTAIHERGISCSVASNSPRSRVHLALDLIGASHYFKSVWTFQDVANGKPEPDVFLKALSESGVASHQCCVVEDSVTGATAAVAANLFTLGFTGTHETPAQHSVRLQNAGASRVINQLSEILHVI